MLLTAFNRSSVCPVPAEPRDLMLEYGAETVTRLAFLFARITRERKRLEEQRMLGGNRVGGGGEGQGGGD